MISLSLVLIVVGALVLVGGVVGFLVVRRRAALPAPPDTQLEPAKPKPKPEVKPKPKPKP